MAKRYRYFVSLLCSTKYGGVSAGNIVINLVERLDTNEAIGTLEHELEENNGCRSCTILNFILLGEEEVDHGE